MKSILTKIEGFTKRSITRSRDDRAGYSLVEILVSGAILVFLFTSVITVVRMSIVIETDNYNRRQARSIVLSEFEQLYNYKNFNTLPADTTFSKSVLVNPLPGNSINGTLTTQITTGSFATNSGTGLKIKHVSLTLTWTGLSGIIDSLQLTKQLANVQ